ncbi:MAG TPA: hypothetical protein VMZ53_29125 [Kofleriaceae bacterium]|nr:hypothetical protein [Kofleriaceae bacterium]
MGFFKDLKNKITGGAATVRVSVPAGRRGAAIPVQVQAQAKTNGKVSAVYLLVRATENAQFKDSNNEKVSGSKVSYENRVMIAGAQELQEGQTYSWEGQLELPQNAMPSLRGSIIDHTWEVQAGLDMPGNDPDSGWQSFDVQ